MKFLKGKKEGKIIVKEVPEAFGGPYVPEQRRRDLRRFALTPDALEGIEKRRREHLKLRDELLRDLGLVPERPWWESD